MAIKASLSADEFVTQFRQIRNDNFSVRALYALFEYFENLSEEMGEDIEFDPIAICCEYSEYGSVKEFTESYQLGEHQKDKSLEDLEDVLRYRGHDPITVKNYDGKIVSIIVADANIDLLH